MEKVIYSIDSKAGIITLQDSENGNRLSTESLSLMVTSLKKAIDDIEVRVIIFRARGDSFCLGMDFSELLSAADSKENEIKESIGLYANLLKAIYTSPKPVISLIDGAVKGGGVGLACACDIVLATDRSSFEFSEAIFGLIPANVLPFVYSLRLSPQKARYLIITAKNIKADEALRLDMVDEVFPQDNFERGIKRIMKQLFRISPAAIERTKKFTHSIDGLSVEEACEIAQDELLHLVKDPNVIKAIAEFSDGGTPEWFQSFNPEGSII